MLKLFKIQDGVEHIVCAENPNNAVHILHNYVGASFIPPIITELSSEESIIITRKMKSFKSKVSQIIQDFGKGVIASGY